MEEKIYIVKQSIAFINFKDNKKNNLGNGEYKISLTGNLFKESYPQRIKDIFNSHSDGAFGFNKEYKKLELEEIEKIICAN